MEKTSEYFEALLPLLAEREGAPETVFWRAMDLDLIQKHMPATTDTLIDLGCGTGEYAAALAGLFRHIYLIDISRPTLAVAASRARAAAPEATVHQVCVDFRRIEERWQGIADVVLATGASSCYQANAWSVVCTTARSLLKDSGLFYGDVWNRYGLALSAAYARDFENLCCSALLEDPMALQHLLIAGHATEVAGQGGHRIEAYQLDEIAKTLFDAGFRNVELRGRRTVSLFLPEDIIQRAILDRPQSLQILESLVSGIREYVAVSPKITFIASL